MTHFTNMKCLLFPIHSPLKGNFYKIFQSEYFPFFYRNVYHVNTQPGPVRSRVVELCWNKPQVNTMYHVMDVWGKPREWWGGGQAIWNIHLGHHYSLESQKTLSSSFLPGSVVENPSRLEKGKVAPNCLIILELELTWTCWSMVTAKSRQDYQDS